MERPDDLDSPRFRLVLEASFPQASPVDPSGYDDLFEKWKVSLSDSPVVPCTEIDIREIRTIGKQEYHDYDWWPVRRQYDIPAPPFEERGLRPLRIEPDYADAYVFVGLLLSQIPGRLPDAIAECERALIIRPSHQSGRRLLERLEARRDGSEVDE